MHKIWMYNPSTTFYVLYKVVSMLFNAKYLARVRLIKKKNEKDFWEHMVPEEWEQKYGGEAPNITEFWPPKQYSTNALTRQDILDQNLMVFNVIGDQGDKMLFPKWEPLG